MAELGGGVLSCSARVVIAHYEVRDPHGDVLFTTEDAGQRAFDQAFSFRAGWNCERRWVDPYPQPICQVWEVSGAGEAVVDRVQMLADLMGLPVSALGRTS